MPSQRNTYRKLDRDTSRNKVDKESYFDCRNMRVMGDDPNESGALVNMPGNELIMNGFPTYISDCIIGGKQIRDKVVLLSTHTHYPGQYGGHGRIWTINLKETTPTPILIYNGLLNLSWEHPINNNIITRWESEDVQKVYWADGYNYLRYCNIADPDLSLKDPDDFNIISNISFESPTLESMEAGRIPVGRVQYSYRLYKKHGGQSAFVPPSRMFNLTTSSEGVEFSNKYLGAERLDDDGEALSSGKGIRMKIDNLDTDYDKVEIIAIHYADAVEEPDIYVVTTIPIADTVYFTDTGVYEQGTYTLSEYVALSNLFTPKTIATKNNILFAANLTEEEFDIDYDARAYRYKLLSTPLAKISNNDGAYYLAAATGNILAYGDTPVITSLAEVPTDFDCLCEVNDLTIDPAGKGFIYQSDGSTLGGEGVNVSYQFKIDSKCIDYSGDNTRFYVGNVGVNEYFTDNASPYNSGTRVGYPRDEIYRFGVVLVNTKGQASPVKWIGDIRFPSHDMIVDGLINQSNFSLTHPVVDTHVTYARNLHIEFTLNNLPDDIAGYQIVRVERKEEDKTILFQGKLGVIRTAPAVYFGQSREVTALDYGPTLGPSDYNTVANYNIESIKSFQAGYTWIMAPELSYFKNFSFKTGDYLQVVGYMAANYKTETLVRYDYAETALGLSHNEIHNSHVVNKFVDYNPVAYNTDYVKEITEGWLIKTNDAPDSFIIQTLYDTLNYNNVVYAGPNEYVSNEGACAIGNAGTGALIKFKEAVNLDLTSLPNDSYPIINYRRKSIQYGGNTFEARSSNIYIPAGEYTKKTSTLMISEVFGGDSFIGFFDNLLSSFNQSYIDYGKTSASLAMIDLVPLESSINLNLSNGMIFNRVSRITIVGEADVLAAYTLLREENNDDFTWQFTKKPSLKYEEYTVEFNPNWPDYYLYNTVYSRDANAKPFFAVEEDYEAIKVSDTKVSASMAKFDEEEIDSWTNFQINESITVDGNYGPINYLIVMNNNMLFYQDNAFGTLSVLDRSLIQDSEGRNLTLGEGEVLQRYDMISTDIGCSTRGSLLATPSFLIWFDAKKRRIYRLTKSIENLGVIKGVNSYLQNIPEEVITNDNIFYDALAGISMVYNSRFNEVWFTVKTNGYDGETLVYNEVLDAFTGFIDNPRSQGYLSQDNVLVTHEYRGLLYRENYEAGTRCKFNGIVYPSYVEVLVNTAETLVFTLTNLEFTTEVLDNSDINILDETISSLRVTNDYQDTGVKVLTPGTNIRRLLRTWRFNSLRDQTYNARLRDTYARVRLTHTNTSLANRKIVLHDLTSIFAMPVESVSNKR